MGPVDADRTGVPGPRGFDYLAAMNYRETTTAATPCPRCSAALFAGQVGHLDALGCGGCGGLWLDNAGSTAILHQYDFDAERLAQLVDGNAAKREVRSPFEAAKGPCPVCAGPLQVTDHQGVRLDFCAAHGTFFDRGELSRIVQGAKPAALTPTPAPVRGPTLEEIQTTMRHEIARREDPLGTALRDWATGGPAWVNSWRL
jgi:Zn-finger nucleic acid-binding protein